MYVSPVLSKTLSQTPKEYTSRARDEINKKLNLNNTATSLRHGPSPLQRVASTASDSSLTRTVSNDSVDTITTDKRKSGFFGRLRHRSRNEDSDKDSIMSDVIDECGMETEMQSIHPVPSIASTTYSTASSMSRSDSVFSTPNTLATQYTNASDISFTPQYTGSKTPLLTLQQALPQSFEDMYSPELMANPNLLIDGRPMFTRRALQDWELNDIRSLLIIERLRAEWNGEIPIIYSPQGFKFEYLPLDADDNTVIRVLVESDIYKEAKLDVAFRIQTAKFTLNGARMRHEQMLALSGFPISNHPHLSKPEWRNVIENFLLNLAVESQCRSDFKKLCHELKKWKRQQSAQPVSVSSSKSISKGSLLKKAILNDVSQSTLLPPQQVKLTKEEKAQLWTEVQEKVYARIGLDWTPDRITT